MPEEKNIVCVCVCARARFCVYKNTNIEEENAGPKNVLEEEGGEGGLHGCVR